MKKQNKVLASLLVVGGLASLTALGVFGLFSATTQNAGNEIRTGTVTFSDNDSGSALYSVTDAKPGDTVSKCIKATYTGTLPAEVHLYTSSSPGPLAQYVDLTITKGTQATSVFPSCSGFTPATTDATAFSGTLKTFEQTHTSYATAIDTDPEGQTGWFTGNSMVYKIDATLQAGTPDSGQGSSSGTHTFIWEAQND